MVSLIVAGRLLGASLACGLNVYATIAVLGVALRLGWIEPLPTSLHGLENGIIIAAASVLLVFEMAASAIPVLEAAWEAVHTIVRPMMAMALAWLALETSPLAVQMAGACAAGSVALAAHAAKVGLRLVEARRRAVRIAISTIEDLLAVGLAIAALAYPAVALGLAVAILGLLATVGPRLWRAAVFGTRSVTARVRGFFGTRDFRTVREIPRTLRALVLATEAGSPVPRAVRATLGAGVWRNGWLVFEGQQAAFLCHRRMRPLRIEITSAGSAVRPGFLADALDIVAAGSRTTLFLLKDGPVAEASAGALPAGREPAADSSLPANGTARPGLAAGNGSPGKDPPAEPAPQVANRAGSPGMAVALVAPLHSPVPRPGPARV